MNIQNRLNELERRVALTTAPIDTAARERQRLHFAPGGAFAQALGKYMDERLALMPPEQMARFTARMREHVGYLNEPD